MSLSNGFSHPSREVPAAKRAINTHNPVRNIVENMQIIPNPDKKMIALSIGDPTIFGNLPLSEETVKAVFTAMEDVHHHGYGPSQGIPPARAAIASHFTQNDVTVNPDDVILTNGCSGALDLCIGALAEEHHNILIPRPGFSIYETLSVVYKVNVKYYDLDPEKDWEIDLDSLESAIDEMTAAIIVCNPSNPCGSVWSKEHILEIISLAEKHNLPLIADEVYADMVFSDVSFYSFGHLSKNVPVLVTGGLAKRWLAPGWRIGWIIIYDKDSQFKQVRTALGHLSQRILGPNSLIQSAIPDILRTNPEFYQRTIQHIQSNAVYAYRTLKQVTGLKPVMPAGAMYMMVGIDKKYFPDLDDVHFTQQLVAEQSVFCLPAKCFKYPGYFRIVLTLPLEVLKEACSRIEDFCKHNCSS